LQSVHLVHMSPPTINIRRAPLCSLCRSIPFHDLPPFPDASFSIQGSAGADCERFVHEPGKHAPIPECLGLPHHPDLASLRSTKRCGLCSEIERRINLVLESLAEEEDFFAANADRNWIRDPSDPSFQLFLTRRGGDGQATKGRAKMKADGFWVVTRSKSNPQWLFVLAIFGACVRSDDSPLATRFTGRPILGTPLDDGSLKQIKRWVRECDEHHSCLAGADAEFPTRVLEIGDASVRLLEPAPGVRGRYAALSYCWGTNCDKSYVTTSAVLESRKAPGGIDVAALPKTFQDSIFLCRYLGIRYLWGDGLCIIQDDVHDCT
jgi:hypothetical protein